MNALKQDKLDDARPESFFHKQVSDWRSLKSVYNSAFLCSLGFFMVGFLIPIVAYDYMSASAIEVALVFSMLTLGAAVFSPVAGRFTKGVKRRYSVLLGALVRAVAYSGMAITIYLVPVIGGDTAVNILIINSLVWGVGGAFYRVGIDAEVSERVLHENRAEAFGRREAANARGSIVGAYIGFTILLGTDELYTVFLFYALMNVIGGILVIRVQPLLEEKEETIISSKLKAAIGIGIAALVLAAAIDTFISALLRPFVELYILEIFTTQVEIVALVYLPGGLVSGILGGYMGRLADHSSKAAIVSAAVFVGAISTMALVIVPIFFDNPVDLLLIAILFAIGSVTGTLGYTVMSSVFGTAYEGRAGEGFGMFEGVMGLARFSAPIIGGILWDFIDPTTPFIVVGLTGFLLIPIYVYGVRQYEKVLRVRTS